LRDDGSGEPLDDPGVKPDTPYATVHGSLFAYRRVLE
jgi:hypothetical protein